jgi:hypothetical protein
MYIREWGAPHADREITYRLSWVPQEAMYIREWGVTPRSRRYPSFSRAARRKCSTARLCSGSVRENVWDPSFFDTK